MLAWGNPSRGDDAVGPWFAARFRHRDGGDIELVEDFQLQVEHLLDCREGVLLLFVDARCADGSDFRFEEVTPVAAVTHTSHALTPAELLGYYGRVFHEQPPPAFLLTVPGESFGLGEPLSPGTESRCRRAARLVERLLAEPDAIGWRAYLGVYRLPSAHGEAPVRHEA